MHTHTNVHTLATHTLAHIHKTHLLKLLVLHFEWQQWVLQQLLGSGTIMGVVAKQRTNDFCLEGRREGKISLSTLHILTELV